MSARFLGKYALLKKIASGGMAEIYLARASGIPGLEKLVVVKRILPALANDREFVRMFLDEARIAAMLHHPNIVQVHDVGEAEGDYFIAMEYLHGEDVRHLMKEVPVRGRELPLEHALHVIIGVAAGLHHAHEATRLDGTPLGLIHRDVTPQNVFVTYDGGVKVVDFGIAKASNRRNSTRSGTLKGKVPYMSPEQCRSDPLDRRSDIYSLGIMLYELTTGYRLYKGNSEFEILKKIVEGTIPRPSVLLPRYPSDLEPIVMRALAKDPKDRYPTARDLQADLESFVRESRLAVSSIALSQFMNEIFAEKVHAWKQAQAAGVDLVAFLVDQAATEADRGEDASDESREWASVGAGKSRARPGGSTGEVDALIGDLDQDLADVGEVLESLESTSAMPVPILLPGGVRSAPPVAPAPASPVVARGVAAFAETIEAPAPTPRPRPPSFPPGLYPTSEPVPPVAPPLELDELAQVRVSGGLGKLWLFVALLSLGALALVLELKTDLFHPARRRAREAEALREAEAARQALEARKIRTGDVVVTSVPDKAAVWLFLGRTPTDSIELSTATEHQLRVESEGFKPFDVTVNPGSWTGEGEAMRAEVRAPHLEAAPVGYVAPAYPPPVPAVAAPPRNGRGRIHVESDPPGSNAWLLVGYTGSMRLTSVPTDRPVELRVQKDGFAPGMAVVRPEQWEPGRSEIQVEVPLAARPASAKK